MLFSCGMTPDQLLTCLSMPQGYQYLMQAIKSAIQPSAMATLAGHSDQSLWLVRLAKSEHIVTAIRAQTTTGGFNDPQVNPKDISFYINSWRDVVVQSGTANKPSGPPKRSRDNATTVGQPTVTSSSSGHAIEWRLSSQLFPLMPDKRARSTTRQNDATIISHQTGLIV